MNNSELASILFAIADGQNFNSSALYEAKHHPETTGNDIYMLRRYMFDCTVENDKGALMDLSDRIRESE